MRVLFFSLWVLVGILAGCLSKQASTPGIQPDQRLHRSIAQVEPTSSWRSGGEPCQEPHYEFKTLADKILTIRQSKCLTFEAPFIHTILGDRFAFVMDTGALSDKHAIELRELIFNLVDQYSSNKLQNIIVAHTHTHGDHTAGDEAFQRSALVRLVPSNLASVKQFFRIQNWPNQIVSMDLGNRILDIIPIPGHDEASIAVYDRHTKTLFTGDSFYPGRLYISDYNEYKSSIQRLVDFSKRNKIEVILGTHIEMSKTPKRDFPQGATYQPDEAPLELHLEDLELLNETLKRHRPRDLIKLDKFIVYPNFN